MKFEWQKKQNEMYLFVRFNDEMIIAVSWNKPKLVSHMDIVLSKNDISQRN